MSAHTPGPWNTEAVRYEGARVVAGRAFDKSAKPVAWVGADDTVEDPGTGRIREVMSDEANANAHLIAAAPELLAVIAAVSAWRGRVTAEDGRTPALRAFDNEVMPLLLDAWDKADPEGQR